MLPFLLLILAASSTHNLIFREVPAEESGIRWVHQNVVFGAVHSHTEAPMSPPEVLEPEPATNYRRWWNNAWNVIERGGQTQAGDWTLEDDARLRTLVRFAHSHNLWIRFYTLDGATTEELSCHGWFRNYNFGSFEAVRQRWRAALAAGVDYIASDQYEQLAQHLKTP